MNDNNGDLEALRIDRQRAAMANGGGASVEMKDGRVTRGIEWALALVGSLIALALAWVANNINDLNTTVARMSSQSEAVVARIQVNDSHDDKQDDRINGLERSVSVIEGRTFRGGKFTPPDASRE